MFNFILLYYCYVFLMFTVHLNKKVIIINLMVNKEFVFFTSFFFHSHNLQNPKIWLGIYRIKFKRIIEVSFRTSFFVFWSYHIFTNTLIDQIHVIFIANLVKVTFYHRNTDAGTRYHRRLRRTYYEQPTTVIL